VTTGLLRDLARTFKAKFPVRIFESVEEAEAWLLNIRAAGNGRFSTENDAERLPVIERLLE
jgi:hypothetical protein